jgi:Arc/MetJ family transcription regulator
MQTRTNIVIDDQLILRAMKKAAVRTKREAVEAALRAFVREVDYSSLLALRGSGGVAEGYDPKAADGTEPADE